MDDIVAGIEVMFESWWGLVLFVVLGVGACAVWWFTALREGSERGQRLAIGAGVVVLGGTVAWILQLTSG